MKQLKEASVISKETKILLTKCRDAIKTFNSSVDIILYGSRARGDANSESDYDLLILTDGEATLEMEDSFRRHLFPIEIETGIVLTVILTSKKDWNSSLYDVIPLYNNIKKEGIIL